MLGLGLGLKAERMHTWWENKSPRVRMAFAKQWDYGNDPATKERRDDLEKFFDDHEKLERENEKWEGIPAPDALNLAKKDEMLVSLRAQHQKMNLKLHQMRGDLETTTPVMTTLKPAGTFSNDGEDDSEGGADDNQEPRLIDRNEVIGKFQVKADSEENFKFWNSKLGQPPEWLKLALGSVGKPGESSMWKPLVIAHCLLGGHKWHKKPLMTLQQLDVAIHKGFPEWLETWREETQDKR